MVGIVGRVVAQMVEKGAAVLLKKQLNREDERICDVFRSRRLVTLMRALTNSQTLQTFTIHSRPFVQEIVQR